MSSTDPDLSVYQEHEFPGRKLIAISIAVLALVWVSNYFIGWGAVPEAVRQSVFVLLVLPATLGYLIGFWRAVKGKGYPAILWLTAFTGIIGLLLIFFLPDKSGSTTNSGQPVKSPEQEE